MLALPSSVLRAAKQLLRSRRGKAGAAVFAAAVVAVYLHSRKGRAAARKAAASSGSGSAGARSGHGSRVAVDAVFFQRLRKILPIVVPSIHSKEASLLLVLAFVLVLRTYVSIKVAEFDGSIVRYIVSRDWPKFVFTVTTFGLIGIPASIINGMMKYLVSRLSLRFRTRLTHHMHEQYLQGTTFYRVSNLDGRIENVDHCLVEDVNQWSDSLANLYSNVLKPLVDLVIFGRSIWKNVGAIGPTAVIFWYANRNALKGLSGAIDATGYGFAGAVLRIVSPSFGKLTAKRQQLEGEYRFCHSRIITYSEEIAFYQGNDSEMRMLNTSFEKLRGHLKYIFVQRLVASLFENWLNKYGTSVVGALVISYPVFNSRAEEYREVDSAQITRDYVSNRRLLLNLADAVGRLLSTYKEISSFAGFTSRVSELVDVLDDLKSGRYKRTLVAGADPALLEGGRGKIEFGHTLRFEDMPIVSPNGDVLVEKLSFEVKPMENVLITGPNGCGKSSLFRQLGGLWPLLDGKLVRPREAEIFYIPQKPYLCVGTLRDQVTYPEFGNQVHASDDDILRILNEAHLGSVAKREGGLDAVCDWADVLSGGEKQRIGMARVYYHRPKYAILDECTSAVSVDVEGELYTNCKSLWKYHDWILRFDGEGGWSYTRIEEDPMYNGAANTGGTPSTVIEEVNETAESSAAAAESSDVSSTPAVLDQGAAEEPKSHGGSGGSSKRGGKRSGKGHHRGR